MTCERDGMTSGDWICTALLFIALAASIRQVENKVDQLLARPPCQCQGAP